jgi:hypothetical protein
MCYSTSNEIWIVIVFLKKNIIDTPVAALSAGARR